MAEVRVDEVTKRLGQVEVIRGMSLGVQDGELFTVVGPSGCGKSTLLHLLAGLEAPTTGRIYFDGEDVTRLAPRERDVALVFQNYALYPHMTVAQNLAFPLRVGGRLHGRDEIDREVRRVAKILGLQALLDRRPRELSGGQRQRVALGRAIIRTPRVFLLDEPLSNLDAQLRAGMRAELRRLHDELGITMIYVTHDQTESMTLSDRLAVLDRGVIQQIGTPREVYDRPANLFVASFIGHPPLNTVPAEVREKRIVVEPLDLPLPPGLLVPGRGPGRVTLAVRPEAVRVLAGRGGAVQGRARLVEPAAGQAWVTVELTLGGGSVTWIGLSEGQPVPAPGQAVSLTVLESGLHLFDAGTGRRLESSETGGTASAGLRGAEGRRA